jgi:hypothetical protein
VSASICAARAQALFDGGEVDAAALGELVESTTANEAFE